MAEIGVRELRKDLAAVLDRVSAGERVVVTNRGRAVAVLSPPPVGDALARGEAEGWLRPASGPLGPAVRRRARADLHAVLEEDRDG